MLKIAAAETRPEHDPTTMNSTVFTMPPHLESQSKLQVLVFDFELVKGHAQERRAKTTAARKALAPIAAQSGQEVHVPGLHVLALQAIACANAALEMSANLASLQLLDANMNNAAVDVLASKHCGPIRL
jgi:hypothetical protein